MINRDKHRRKESERKTKRDRREKQTERKKETANTQNHQTNKMTLRQKCVMEKETYMKRKKEPVYIVQMRIVLTRLIIRCKQKF